MKMLNSKKGFNTLVTIVALIFIAISFVVFLFMFKQGNDTDIDYSKNSFRAIDTEMVLSTFLKSNSNLKPDEVEINVENSITNGQLAALTCTSKNNKMYFRFVNNANSYFSKMYKDTWRLELLYYDNRKELSDNPPYIAEAISLGSQDFTISSVMRQYESYSRKANIGGEIDAQRNALFAIEAKGSQVAMQYLPCSDEYTTLKMVLLLSKEPEDMMGERK